MPASDDYATELRGDVGQQATSGGQVKSWFDHLINGLTLVGITALVGITWDQSREITRIATYIAEREKQHDRDHTRYDTAFERHDQRLDRLEQQRRDNQPHD